MRSACCISLDSSFKVFNVGICVPPVGPDRGWQCMDVFPKSFSVCVMSASEGDSSTSLLVGEYRGIF